MGPQGVEPSSPGLFRCPIKPTSHSSRCRWRRNCPCPCSCLFVSPQPAGPNDNQATQACSTWQLSRNRRPSDQQQTTGNPLILEPSTPRPSADGGVAKSGRGAGAGAREEAPPVKAALSRAVGAEAGHEALEGLHLAVALENLPAPATMHSTNGEMKMVRN